MRLELEDNWAELHDPTTIPHGKTKQYRRTFYRMVAVGATMKQGADDTAMAAMLADGGLETMDDLADALTLAVVKEWSFGPVDEETLLAIPTASLDEIQKACATDEYQRVLQPDFGFSPEPDSPSKPSGD